MAKQWSKERVLKGRVIRVALFPSPNSQFLGKWKINMDSGQNLKYEIGMVDGVFQDADSLWCLGFARNIELCSTYETKLWDILDSLKHAWKLGCRDVLLELDCLEAPHHIKGPNK
ncbi:hypothetical protein GOBAR_AA16063 [Gossypium barbadense]|uniref:RNase H type-1 domain-containing protein n=1 Tax=Gossypium barbadense TaxID=3634 RepID=A0A2P5XMQ7_GOSBA|nr:hypothetical protein GOBAR_AA16063 [Gossypium barbadense]